MTLPHFAQRPQGASGVLVVDIPSDLDELVAWMYVLAKNSCFPVQMDVLGARQSFESLEEMFGFIMGVKRTSDLFLAATPVSATQ